MTVIDGAYSPLLFVRELHLDSGMGSLMKDRLNLKFLVYSRERGNSCNNGCPARDGVTHARTSLILFLYTSITLRE